MKNVSTPTSLILRYVFMSFFLCFIWTCIFWFLSCFGVQILWFFLILQIRFFSKVLDFFLWIFVLNTARHAWFFIDFFKAWMLLYLNETATPRCKFCFVFCCDFLPRFFAENLLFQKLEHLNRHTNKEFVYTQHKREKVFDLVYINNTASCYKQHYLQLLQPTEAKSSQKRPCAFLFIF